MYVYRILNKLNGRMYIGSTNNYLARKQEHFGALRKRTHHNRFLQIDYNDFGEKNFCFEVLYNDINDRTKLLLKEYDLILRNRGKCYNIDTNCPVFDPSEKQDWSMYRKGFKPDENKKAKAKKKKHHKLHNLRINAAKGFSNIKVDIPPFRKK